MTQSVPGCVAPLGAFRRHPMELRADVHAATGEGGQGQIHNTNMSAANTDYPVITGVRFIF